MNYEKEYKNFSEWWEQLTANNPEWKTLERLAAKDAWMEAAKRAEANGLERSSDKCHIQNVSKRTFFKSAEFYGWLAFFIVFGIAMLAFRMFC